MWYIENSELFCKLIERKLDVSCGPQVLDVGYWKTDKLDVSCGPQVLDVGYWKTDQKSTQLQTCGSKKWVQMVQVHQLMDKIIKQICSCRHWSNRICIVSSGQEICLTSEKCFYDTLPYHQHFVSHLEHVTVSVLHLQINKVCERSTTL
jgi:hypothetical protein